MLRRGDETAARAHRGASPGTGGFRTGLAVRAGRTAEALSRRLGRGSGGIIGGRVALVVDPGVLRRLAAGRRVVLVTGTNGKTTTSHLLAAALRVQGDVAHNGSGANMVDGVIAALMAQPRAGSAVLEVDELHLAPVTAAVGPAAVVLLNLTRDQLDRSTEVAAVAAAIRASLVERRGALVVANCDDPVVTAAVDGLPRVLWVAGGAGWVDDSALCPRCGHLLHRTGREWSCAGCGLHRPPPDWELERSLMRGPASRTALELRLPGEYNRGNALAAVATAAALGVPPDRAAAAIADVRSVADRYAVVQHGRHRLTLLLAKNPAGWRETLPLAARADGILLAVNAREADGRDTSWLWDVPFEQLTGRPTAVSGEAAADLGLRLAYADVAHTTAVDPLAALEALPDGEITVVANYTAFAGLAGRLPHGGRS